MLILLHFQYDRLRQRIGHAKRVFEASDGPTPQFCLPSTVSDDIEERWIVTRIGGKRTRGGILYYQVFWEGYKEPTWEPADAINEDAPQVVKQFMDGNLSGSKKRRRPG